MWKQIGQKLHNVNWSRLCRRGVALSLALSMLLPTVSYGFDALDTPTAVVPGEEPTIIIEANAVINRWYDPALGDPTDYLTGELEVAVRVKSGINGTEPQAFNTLGIALKYNADILTPCRWTSKWDDTYGVDIDGRKMNLTPVAAEMAYDEESMGSMQTLKNNKISTASAHICETVATETNPAGDGYVYIRLDADRPIVLGDEKREGDMFQDEQGTVLGVISFQYDVEQYKILAKDAEQWLSPGTAAGDGGETARALNDKCLLQFAANAELNDHYSVELYYDSEKNGMFYSSDPNASRFINQAPTFNRLTLNEKTYTEKEIKANQINFVLTNKTTYNDGGLSLDDLATVLFYDWDDTLIGVLIVPRDGDARKLVNDYVRDHMIHPDLRGNTNVSSLARTDNYRGKYPSSKPMAEDGVDATMDSQRTDGKKGADYPLTNKLDYVFLKRPLELTSKGTNATGQPISTWTQPGETTPEWDTVYPYIHGWAVIPDEELADIKYTHPKNLWTTIGMGELSTYNGAANGGYKDMSGAPAKLDVEGEDFTIADFNFSKRYVEDGVQKTNSLKPGSVYAVKAVYEPGDKLLNNLYLYRIISKPYYSKLNFGAASNGGAYSIDVTFERASLEVDFVLRGVARMRTPYVRQDTTTDLLWEENEDLGVSHNLPNATNYEAYTSKAKSTYTKVDISNTEEIPFSLTLSARQNKIDYYLKESYGSSFVAGVSRSDNDSNRSAVWGTLDNYNYFVDGETNSPDRIDEWYDAAYSDRSGSRGFVLMGTLNKILELATQYNEGEITSTNFSQYTNAAVFSDINLCMADGVAPTLSSQLTKVRNAIFAAAADAKTNHYGDPDYWNNDPEHDCAQLNYHQLQLFVVDYLENGSATLLSPSDADKEIIKWCHLHEECVAKTLGKPRNWGELVSIAKEEGAAEKIALLTPTEMESIAHLRDSTGSVFATVNDFATEVIKAVKAGNTTWDTIQDYIIRGKSDASYAQANYWWYDGAASVPLNSLANTVAAAQDAITPVEAPDGSKVIRTAKINQLETIFEANAVAGGVTTAWNNATKNLCITKTNPDSSTSEGEKFDSFSDFREAFIAAVTAAKAAKVTLADTASPEDLKEYWQKLQYFILHTTYDGDKNPTYPAFPAEPTDAQKAEMEKYWWYDGNSRIVDLASLITAAERANAGDATVLTMLTVDDLYSKNMPELHFRSGFNGTTDLYTDSNLDDFKTAVRSFVRLTNVTKVTASSGPDDIRTCWNQLQYWLLHPGCNFSDINTALDYRAEAGVTGQGYYWWRKGAEGEKYEAFSPGKEDSNIETLMEAAYRYVKNGNPNALDGLDEDAAAAFRLIPRYVKEELKKTWNDLDKYDATTVSDMKDALIALMKETAITKDNYKKVTWRQIQHYLLGKGYLSEGADGLPSDSRSDPDGYWWRSGDDNPGAQTGPIEYDIDKFLEILDQYIAGDIDDAALTAAVDTYYVSDRLNIHVGTKTTNVTFEAATNGTAAQKTQQKNTRTRLVNLAKNLKNKQKVSSAIGLVDWYVLQYYSFTNVTATTTTLKTPAQAKAELSTVTWKPADGHTTPAKAEGLRVMMLMAPAPGPDSSVEVDEETGIATVTTVVETELENGILTVETITTVDPSTNETVTTTITTLTDWEGNVISTSETITKEEPPVVTESPEPVESVEPEPTESIEPEETPKPTESPEATESVEPEPTESIKPEETPKPTESPEAVESVEPEETPVPTESPGPITEESTETMPEVVESPLISTSTNDMINNPAGTVEGKDQQTEQQEKGGSYMLTTSANNGENVLLPTSSFLPLGKLKQTTNGTITTTSFSLNETTKSAIPNLAHFVLPNRGLAGWDDGKLWRIPKPKIAAPPFRLISLSTDLLDIPEDGRVRT